MPIMNGMFRTSSACLVVLISFVAVAFIASSCAKKEEPERGSIKEVEQPKAEAPKPFEAPPVEKPKEEAKVPEIVPKEKAVVAQEKKAEKPADAIEKPKAPKALKASGTVAKYDAGKIIALKVKDKETSFDVTADTKIKGEVKEGAKAMVMYKKEGDKMVTTTIAVAEKKVPKEETKVPVYNIEVEPKKKSAPLVLIPGERTRIDFYIGPRSEESVVPDIPPSPILKALAKKEPLLQLTVTLYCNLSNLDTYQQRKIIYDRSRRRSEIATFTITPSVAAVSSHKGLGKLIFVVDADGMEIDIIQLSAFVGNTTPEGLEAYVPPRKMILDDLNPREISMPDLIIAIAPHGGGKLPITIRPILPELCQHLKDAIGEAQDNFWVFQSGVNKTDLDGLVKNAYNDLRALAEQNNEKLQNVYKHFCDMALSPGAARLIFSKDDTQKMLNTLASTGALLYYRIFERGEPNLLKTMQAINAFKLNRHLRVRILAADVYAPWQIIYTQDPAQLPIIAEWFWGFRYELGTLQIVDSAQGRTRTVLEKPRHDEVLFAAWRGTSKVGVTDEVKERAEMVRDDLEKKVGKIVVASNSKKDFLDRIKNDAQKIKLIVGYGHASSGTQLVCGHDVSGEEILYPVHDLTGPCFIFAEGGEEFLLPRDLEKISMAIRADDPNPVYLKSQPIVIFNACETGAFGTRSSDNNGFVGAFTRMGARSVFVTEAPVWSNFAQHFGSQLIDHLFAGEEVRAALLKIRKVHLEQMGNPLGLAYTLYGNAAARIAKP